MEYEKPKLEWVLWGDSDVVTSSEGGGNGLLTDENEGGSLEGLPGFN